MLRPQWQTLFLAIAGAVVCTGCDRITQPAAPSSAEAARLAPVAAARPDVYPTLHGTAFSGPAADSLLQSVAQRLAGSGNTSLVETLRQRAVARSQAEASLAHRPQAPSSSPRAGGASANDDGSGPNVFDESTLPSANISGSSFTVVNYSYSAIPAAAASIYGTNLDITLNYDTHYTVVGSITPSDWS